MFKKHQRWTALLMAIALLGLVLDAAAPSVASAAEKPCPEEKSDLAKGDSTEKTITLESDGPGPEFVEQAGPAWGRAGRKNTVRAVILGIVAIAIVWLIIRFVIGHAGRE